MATNTTPKKNETAAASTAPVSNEAHPFAEQLADAWDMPADAIQVANYHVYRTSEATAPDANGRIMPGVEFTRGKNRTHCGNVPIFGYIADLKDNPNRFKDQKDKNGKVKDRFFMLAITLTKPCVGIKGESEVKLLEPGDTILVALNHKLDMLAEYGAHDTHTVEVCLRPQGLKEIAGGFKVREWDIFPVSDGQIVTRTSVKSGAARMKLVEKAAVGVSALPMLPEVRPLYAGMLPENAGQDGQTQASA